MGRTSDELTVLWSAEGSEACIAPPMAVGDLVLCFTFDRLVAYSLYDRAPRWVYPVQADVVGAMSATDRLYFVDGRELIVLDPTSGSWRVLARGTFTNSLAAGANNTVIATLSTGALCGVDAVTGVTRWTTEVGKSTPGPLGVSDDGAVVCCVCDQTVIAVNTDWGEVRWRYQPDDPMAHIFPDFPVLNATRRPCIGGGVVVVAGLHLYGADLVRGQQRWIYSQGGGAASQWTDALPVPGTAHFLIGKSHGRNDDLYNNGNIDRIDFASGAQVWSHHLLGAAEHATPACIGIADDEVFAPIETGTVFRLHVADGSPRAVHELGTSAAMGVALNNGTLFVPTADGVRALGFGAQNAVYLSGGARLEVTTTATAPYRFPTGDLTIEAWLRTNRGGELFSSLPADVDGNQFRVNITPAGRVRFGVMSAAQRNGNMAVTGSTLIADGAWHHLAITRAATEIVICVDGQSEHFGTGGLTDPLPLGPQNALIIGGYRPTAESACVVPFDGLVLDLRLWDRALNMASIHDRMNMLLRGDEPGLIGYWHLDAPDVAELVDAVAPHDHHTLPIDVRPTVTDLALDQDVFPYLLDDRRSHWPYHGYWSVRGELRMRTQAAATDGVVCYGTDNQLYGVAMLDGRRRWSRAAPRGTSAPVADGGAIYYADHAAVHALSAGTGEALWSTTLPTSGISPRMDPPIPVLTVDTLIMVDAAGCVLAFARDTGTLLWQWSDATGGVPAELCLSHAADGSARVVYCRADHRVTALSLTGTQAGQPIWQIPLNNTAATSTMTGLCCAASRILYADTDDQAIVCCLEASHAESWRVSLAQLQQGARVTGLTARPEDNLLVVTTSMATVLGLNLATGDVRWAATIPAGGVSPSQVVHPAVNAPHAIYTAIVSGTVAAIDADSGALIGLFDTGAPIVTCSVIESGAIYFGTDDTIDATVGALRSVVFGESYALRVGLDAFGNPLPTGTGGYLRVEAPNAPAALPLRNVEQCCVEAWVNTRNGGEIISICESPSSRIGLRAWLEGSGAVHFQSRVKPPGEADWQGIHVATAATTLCDGRWHHIAISRPARTDVRIYIDGMRQANVHQPDPPPPVSEVPGLRLMIGADATAAGTTPANQYAGLLGEVRLWGTYLVPQEITDRMHVKLRGDEPDLLGFWSFDADILHDASRRGLDALAVGAGVSHWLTDLVFDRPDYPYIMAVPTVVSPAPAPPATTYEVHLMVHRADGTLLPGEPITLWYTRHPGEPASVTVQVQDAATGQFSPPVTLPSVRPNEEVFGQNCISTMTDGSTGHLVVRIASTDLNHGPSIDLNAGFMPANERFRLNVTLPAQHFEVPVQPRLTARSALVQDYRYTHGNQIDSSRDFATYRTVINASNANGAARPDEAITIWGREPVVIESNGLRTAVNAYNSVTLRTDAAGNLTLVTEATSLRTPELLVCAGFMHRNDRFVIAPDRDAQKRMRQVDAADLTTPRMTRWTPAGPVNAALLTGDYAARAQDIAGAIRTVLAATPAPGGPGLHRAGRSRYPRLVGDTPASFDDMTQPPAAPVTDAALTLRTMPHIARTTPLDPDLLRTALSGAVGMSFACDGTAAGLHISYIRSPQELHLVLATPPGALQEPLLGSWWDDAWDTVTDVATTIYDGAVSIVLTVADTIEVAIRYVGDQIRKVVPKCIADAVDLVVAFFDKMKIALEDLLAFLRHAFDWGAILATHAVLRDTMNNTLIALHDGLAAQLPAIKAALHVPFDRLSAAIDQLLGQDLPPITVRGGQRSGSLNWVDDAGVASRLLFDKLTLHAPYAVVPANGLVPPGLFPDLDGADTFGAAFRDALGNRLTDANGLYTLTVSDLVSLVADAVRAIIGLMKRVLDAVLDDFVAALDGLRQALNEPMSIPFLSPLYYYITRGSTLTLLDLCALVAAMPLSITYSLVTRRYFGTDMAALPEGVPHMYRITAPHPELTLPIAALAAGPGTGRPVSRTVRLGTSALGDPAPPGPEYYGQNVAYCVMRHMYGGYYAFADFYRMTRVKPWKFHGGPAPAPAPADEIEIICNVITGVCGIAQGCLLYFGSDENAPDRKWAGVNSEIDAIVSAPLWVGTAVQAGRALNAARKFKWNSQGTMEWYDKAFVLVSTVYGIRTIVTALIGTAHPNEIGGAEIAETCISILPETYRIVAFSPATAPEAFVLSLFTGACGETTAIMHGVRTT
ncbi:MAG TPA: PQQ-binding-like beta-propeller repeat protein [Longimicrobiales bacterium]|nr:PQQ-binding-like beta-propeller repeat protein [Longimicrobiales bacterium]